MRNFSLSGLFSFKSQVHVLPVPEFSNFRIENGVKLADVKMIPTDVAEAEYKKLQKLGCCDYSCNMKTLSERQLENWNDRLSEACCRGGSRDYVNKVSVALFNASLSMQGISKIRAPQAEPIRA